MNGAESLVRTAVTAGVEVCFTNPGTTEMGVVVALDSTPGIRAVLGLFEGVCTGAADGYGRMADRPALTLLHLGPGLANGIANLHNARRARSPIVNVIGQHSTWHRDYDVVLTSDIAGLARPVSRWLREVNSASELAPATAEAIAAAGRAPGSVATLIAPFDCQWGQAESPAPPRPVPAATPVAESAVKAAASLLRKHRPSALFVGGQALRERGLRAAARVAEASGCQIICEFAFGRCERGAGLPAMEQLPYPPTPAVGMLSRFQSIVIAGTTEPIAVFGFPNSPSRLLPDGVAVAELAGPEEDVCTALEALAEALNAPKAARLTTAAQRPPRPSGALTPRTIAAAIGALLPENAIIVNEAVTTGFELFRATAGVPRHTLLGIPGGALGGGLPAATGAAVARPESKVIAFEADGGAMYAVQSLWTQAREQLDVVTLICSNRCYRILRHELARVGIAEPGPKACALTDLSHPDVDFVHLARGMGVPAVRVENAEDLTRELERALSTPGPKLIEMMVA